jgi:hypothetical protein
VERGAGEGARCRWVNQQGAIGRLTCLLPALIVVIMPIYARSTS